MASLLGALAVLLTLLLFPASAHATEPLYRTAHRNAEKSAQRVYDRRSGEFERHPAVDHGAGRCRATSARRAWCWSWVVFEDPDRGDRAGDVVEVECRWRTVTQLGRGWHRGRRRCGRGWLP